MGQAESHFKPKSFLVIPFPFVMYLSFSWPLL